MFIPLLQMYKALTGFEIDQCKKNKSGMFTIKCVFKFFKPDIRLLHSL